MPLLICILSLNFFLERQNCPFVWRLEFAALRAFSSTESGNKYATYLLLLREATLGQLLEWKRDLMREERANNQPTTTLTLHLRRIVGCENFSAVRPPLLLLLRAPTDGRTDGRSGDGSAHKSRLMGSIVLPFPLAAHKEGQNCLITGCCKDRSKRLHWKVPFTLRDHLNTLIFKLCSASHFLISMLCLFYYSWRASSYPPKMVQTRQTIVNCTTRAGRPISKGRFLTSRGITEWKELTYRYPIFLTRWHKISAPTVFLLNSKKLNLTNCWRTFEPFLTMYSLANRFTPFASVPMDTWISALALSCHLVIDIPSRSTHVLFTCISQSSVKSAYFVLEWKKGLDLIEPAADMGFCDMARRPRGPQAHGIIHHGVV